MARVLTLYLARSVLVWIGLTCLLLLAVYTLIEVIREARSLTGDYGAVQMLWFLMQTTPRRLYDIFPFAALIGTLLGLGALASANELVAMRVAGFDRRQLMVRVLLTVMVCLALMMWMAEWLIPDLEARARAERQQARTGQLHVGGTGQFWLRDGPFMVRLGEAVWVDQEQLVFTDILVYRLDSSMRPEAIITAERGWHSGANWQLAQVSWRELADGHLGRQESADLASVLTPGLFQAAVSRPRLLAMRDLYRMRSYLDRSGLDTGPYDQAFWSRIFFPLNVIAMVLIALPFVFRSARSGNQGAGLFIGVMLGLVFFVVSRLSAGMALLWPLPLWLSTMLPALLIIAVSAVLMRRL
ncbi:MAG: LPS export ABC transporter permease LptG [Wenzhouxiangellaceae bacterium]|nr:MAG: LPS export ABC transporter permease LptG [Wenzhouxiangellaceae bacterium]